MVEFLNTVKQEDMTDKATMKLGTGNNDYNRTTAPVQTVKIAKRWSTIPIYKTAKNYG